MLKAMRGLECRAHYSRCVYCITCAVVMSVTEKVWVDESSSASEAEGTTVKATPAATPTTTASKPAPPAPAANQAKAPATVR
jgi:hypothetical protein